MPVRDGQTRGASIRHPARTDPGRPTRGDPSRSVGRPPRSAGARRRRTPCRAHPQVDGHPAAPTRSPSVEASAVDAASACSRSAIRSSTCSRPTDSRMRSGVTPVAACSSGSSCECVVEAGWMISDFASPTLASRLKIWTLSISSAAGVDAALDAERHDPAEPTGQVALGELVRVVRLEARVADPGDLRSRLQPLRHGQRVLAVARDPQRQRFEALQEQERS